MNNWNDCGSAMISLHQIRIATYRGYRHEFVEWLVAEKLIGLWDNQVAFPVCDQSGVVVGCHLRTSTDWKYQWFTVGEHVVTPLVIGSTAVAKWAFIFESQWDAFAVMAAYGWDTDPKRYADGCVIITRGAENGKLVAGLLPQNCTAYAWKQNDAPRENGRPAAADKWLADIQQNAGCEIRLVITPPEHKDPNDWIRAGATVDDLEKALDSLVTLPPVQKLTRSRVMAEPDWAELGLVVEDEIQQTPFPTEALPESLAAIVRAAARINRVPEGLAALLALGAVSASIGSTLVARLYQDKTTRANLYLLGALPSGEGKSTTADVMLRPFMDRDIAQREEWKLNRWPIAKAKHACIKMAIEQLQAEATSKKLSPAESQQLVAQLADKERELEKCSTDMVEPRLIVEDITTEALVLELSRNNETMALLSSDGGDVVANILGRYRRNTVDDSLFVKAWSGDPVSVNRMGRPSITLRSPCLTTVLLVQLDKLARFFAKKQLIDGGYLPRFLMTRLVNVPSVVSVDMVALDPGVAKAYRATIDDLVTTFRLSSELVVAQSTRAAQQVVVDYHNEIVAKRKVELKDVSGFAARWHEQACRIALILHAAKHGAKAGEEIQEDTVRSAVEIMRWFANEQLAILNAYRDQSRRNLLKEIWIFAQTHAQGFTLRELARAKFTGDTQMAKSILDQMMAKDVMKEEPVKTAGRSTVSYKAVHPGAMALI